MMVADILGMVMGLLVVFFVPGWIIMKLWFESYTRTERVLWSVMLSLMISITVGIYFGYDRTRISATDGGFTLANLWVGEALVITALALMWILKQAFMKKKEFRGRK